MSFEVKGTIIQIDEVQSGTGTNGDWKKQVFVVKYMDGQYEKKLAFTAFNKGVDELEKHDTGETVLVKFNAESREYNNRWYTDMKPWFIQSADGSGSTTPAESGASKDDSSLPF